MSITTGITAHCAPHEPSELEQIRRALASIEATAPRPRTTIAIWSLAINFRGAWSITRTDETVLVMHPDAWRLVERQLIPGRDADPAGVLTTELLGVPVIDIDAGGGEALRLRTIIADAYARALGGAMP